MLRMILASLIVSVVLPLPASAETTEFWLHIKNAAISGHNSAKLQNVTVDQCKAACKSTSKFNCKSFDYDKNNRACDLSKTNKQEAGALKKDYKGNPYDHYALYRYERTPNAAISGHNDKKISNVPRAIACMDACAKEDSFNCKSFDFHKNKGVCDLSRKSASDVALKRNYNGNPYDHYSVVPAKSASNTSSGQGSPKPVDLDKADKERPYFVEVFNARNKRMGCMAVGYNEGNPVIVVSKCGQRPNTRFLFTMPNGHLWAHDSKNRKVCVRYTNEYPMLASLDQCSSIIQSAGNAPKFRVANKQIELLTKNNTPSGRCLSHSKFKVDTVIAPIDCAQAAKNGFVTFKKMKSSAEYEVRVITAAANNAGTDSDIYLMNVKGTFGKVNFGKSLTKEVDSRYFKPGSSHSIKLGRKEYIGKPRSISLLYDPRNTADGTWQPEYLSLRVDGKPTGRMYCAKEISKQGEHVCELRE